MPDRIADPWGPRTPYGASGIQDSVVERMPRRVRERLPGELGTPGSEWPVRVDQYLADGLAPEAVDRWVQSACVLCSNGCGMDIAVKDGRIVGVRGRAVDRTNHGRLGPKGLFGWQANHSGARLTRPLVREHGQLVESDWETAMGQIVERSRRQLAEKGPLSIGFYTTGQFFIEDYYTLTVIGKAGIGTPHMDGNTRLCTATAAAALKENFGSDGQPGSYTDIDHADTFFHFGSNIAEQQTVLYMRCLDRRRGPNPPKFVVVDPRPTPAAQEADLHIAIKNGTNVAFMNGILQQIIANGWIDQKYIAAHTVGFEDLKATVMPYTPERVAELCEVPAEQIREAARILGTGKRVLSTLLQGVYQSNQATAAACQVNNMHLIRGMIGKPGCGIFQMNGQPTSQNTRETGADGDMPGFRNWGNPEHIKELADLWNVDMMVIPHWSPPTHAMQIWRYAEQGSIGMLWITATNPAVSMPDLPRVRRTLENEELFVVVQDAFLTETARYADVVLPAAIWGEKTGTFTNVDRTVHISDKAVEPPGEARTDLDIFLDYARRMEFKDKDGAPLIKWHDPESAFEAWKACSKGRPCDYSGMTYATLRGGSGIQWPCTEKAPRGTERIYTDGHFNTDPEYCETYGQDFLTGATQSAEEYRAMNPAGRARLRPSEYRPSHEEPDDEYPIRLTTGRTLYQFHTRTKTDRAPQLHDAAPDAWVEVSAPDAERLGIAEGDMVRVESRRGQIEARARVSGIKPGVVFVPFHYGYFDEPSRDRPNGRARAANELTMTRWDPISKQPAFKIAAVRVAKVADADGTPSPAPTNTASAPVSNGAGGAVPRPTVGGPAAEATSITREG